MSPVASAASTDLRERSRVVPQAVSGATVPWPGPSSLYRKGSRNSARLEHLIPFDRRGEAEQGDRMPPQSADGRPPRRSADETPGSSGCGSHRQLPPDGYLNSIPAPGIEVSARLRQQLDLEALTAELLAVVDQTMEPPTPHCGFDP